MVLNFTSWASEPVVIEVQTAGSLSSLIEESQKNQITDLTDRKSGWDGYSFYS